MEPILSRKNNMNQDILVDYNNFTFLTDEWMGNRMKVNKYEVEELELIKSIPDIHNLTVLELGGCLGVTSVNINSKLLNKENHVVVEANPKLKRYLEHNKKLNKCEYTVKNCILSQNSDGVFYSYDKLVAGSAHRLDSKESNKVKHIVEVTTPKQLEEEYNLIFDFLVIDIEGGELEFFQDFDLTNFKYILVELHENLMYPGFNKQCLDLLDKKGFKRSRAIGNSILLKK